MKECFKCGLSLPLSEFYAHGQMRDRRLGKCKNCTKSDVRANRRLRLEYYRAYDKARSMEPKRVESRAEYAASEHGREVHAMALRKSAEKFPAKASARIRLNNAVRDGRVVKQPCEVCGQPKAHGHHPDYSKPFDVRWLCSRHHADVHRGRLVLKEMPL